MAYNPVCESVDQWRFKKRQVSQLHLRDFDLGCVQLCIYFSLGYRYTAKIKAGLLWCLEGKEGLLFSFPQCVTPHLAQNRCSGQMCKEHMNLVVEIYPSCPCTNTSVPGVCCFCLGMVIQILVQRGDRSLKGPSQHTHAYTYTHST